MDPQVHVAITRRVRKECVGEFETALAEFARRSWAETGARGVHLLYPPPGSGSTEYGVMRSFANSRDRKAFYASTLYREWLATIAPMTEGEANFRELHGLEAWFRNPKTALPPQWKMVLLTWIGVWPVSMVVPAVLNPLLGPNFSPTLGAGLIAAGIVVVLTWVAMPLLVKIAHRWLNPSPQPFKTS